MAMSDHQTEKLYDFHKLVKPPLNHHDNSQYKTPSSRCILLPLSASGKRRAKTSLRQPLTESALMLEAIHQIVAWHRPS